MRDSEFEHHNLYALRRFLIEAGVRHRHRPVPFGVTRSPLELPEETVSSIASAGNLVGGFFSAINELVLSPDCAQYRQSVPELALLDRPEAAALSRLAPAQLPSMFRMDLVVCPDGSFEASEIELLIGGLGFTDLIRRHAFARDDGKCVAWGVAQMLKFLSGGERQRCSLVVQPTSYLTAQLDDTALFAKSVREFYPEYDVQLIEDLLQDGDGNLVSVKDSTPIRFVHRFFEIYRAAKGEVPNAKLIFDAYRRGTARDIPCLKQFFEEKLTQVLPHIPELESFFCERLGRGGLDRLKAILPRTYLLDRRLKVEWKGLQIPLTSEQATHTLTSELASRFPNGIKKAQALALAQSDPLVADGGRKRVLQGLQNAASRLSSTELARAILEADAALCVATLPRKQRKFVLKQSGFGKGAAEARSVLFLEDLNSREVNEAIEEALASQELYVLQHATPHMRFASSGLFPVYDDHKCTEGREPQDLALRQFSGYARVEPHFFQTGPNQWELGDIAATVTPNKKTHMRTDALVTFVDF